MSIEEAAGVRYCDGDKCEQIDFKPSDKIGAISLTYPFLLTHISEFRGPKLVELVQLFLTTYPAQIRCPICHSAKIRIFGIHAEESRIIFECLDEVHPHWSSTFEMCKVNYLILELVKEKK